MALTDIMNNILSLIGRSKPLITDLPRYEQKLRRDVQASAFLVIGGAGSIGQAVVKEIFKRNPRKLHVVDISENNLAELVRDIRSSFGYIQGEFRTFALDVGSLEFDVYFSNEGPFEYVLNLSALKHVRSEKDPYTLMRMVDVNILNTIKTIEMAAASGARKYFCVSTDKAANPVNMMGASKRIMEMFVQRFGERIPISTARFANVAFSDGSLLHGFQQRLLKDQPIAAPNDVRRYFVTPQESGELCLMSAIFGENGDIFFPKLNDELHMRTFSEIAVAFLNQQGYEAVACASEEEARQKVAEFKEKRQWPCYFSASDTTGEKEYEEFYSDGEEIDLERFESLGIVRNSAAAPKETLDYFLTEIKRLKKAQNWTRTDLITLFQKLLPGFKHYERGKFLDEKM
jgi:UDP-N-acetylglucosamine 4,6-dehydratase